MIRTVDKIVTNLEMEFESRNLKKGSAPSLTSIREDFMWEKDSRHSGLYPSLSISYH